MVVIYRKKQVFQTKVIKINYTDELVDSVNKYNENLEMVAQNILNLKIDFNEKDIEVRNLYSLFRKLSVINNVKSRKTTEKLLHNVINEYAYQLQIESGKYIEESDF